IFRGAHRGEGGLAAQQRRFIRGGRNDDAARESVFAKIVFNKFLELAAALANERDDDDVGIGVPREHAEQNRLADSGTREDTKALTFAARHEGVQRAHAEIELAADAGARVRGGRSGAQSVRLHALWKGAL